MEVDICNEYEEQMSRLGREMASEWKEWANDFVEQHNKSTKDILHKLASDLHAQA